jgi:hypothetical protein
LLDHLGCFSPKAVSQLRRPEVGLAAISFIESCLDHCIECLPLALDLFHQADGLPERRLGIAVAAAFDHFPDGDFQISRQ